MKKIIVCITLIILFEAHCLHAMEEEQETESKEYTPAGGWLFNQPEIVSETKTISCKEKAGVTIKDLSLEREMTDIAATAKERQFLYSTASPEDFAATPRKNATELLPAVDLTYDDAIKQLFFLGISKHNEKKLFLAKNITLQPPQDQKSLPVIFWNFKKPYYFYRLAQDNQPNKILVQANPLTLSHRIEHNKPIIAFGAMDDIVFTGSTWPSIKRTFIPKSASYDTDPKPFIDNAFLLACNANGMIIAKINEDNNAGFWFWRRLGKKEDVQVTLYALFFDPIHTATTVTKKIVAEAIKKASQSSDSIFNFEYAKPKEIKIGTGILQIKVVTLATNVVLTSDQQENPSEKFPKAAIAQNSALVIHTQRYENSEKDSFSNINPKVSWAFKNAKNNWENTPKSLDEWIKKKKDIAKKPIRLPDLYEIKDVYITKINNQPIALLVTKTDKKGSFADGVYAIPLTGQQDYDLLEPFWHVNIKYSGKAEYIGNKLQRRFDEFWRATEKIVASTFDYQNNKLFLIIEPLSKKVEKKQELITINIAEMMNDEKRLKMIHSKKLHPVHQELRKEVKKKEVAKEKQKPYRKTLTEVHQELLKKHEPKNK